MGEHSDSFSAVSGFGADAESNVAGTDSSDRVFGAEVMANAFDTLGIHPAVGNFFTPNEAIAGRDLVVVLSYGYWQQRFGKSPDVIGQTIRVDGISRRIIGVMPAGVRFPYADTQFVIPVAFKGGDPLDAWRAFDLRMFGRLKDGVSPAQAQAELHRLHAALLPLFPWRMPDSWASELTVVPLLESEVGATRPRLLLLFGAVALILLIACANVANLMLARAAGREREMALRGALGASSGRLIRQLLSESLILGAMAGVAGLVVAAASLRALVRLLPADTPRLNEIALHWPVFLFAAAASLMTGFIFGLIPALKMASPNLQGMLGSGSRAVAGKASQFRLSMALVIGTDRIVRRGDYRCRSHAAQPLQSVEGGSGLSYRTGGHCGGITGCSGMPEKGRCNGFFTTLLNNAQGIAGMEAVALTDSLPLSGRDDNYVYDAEGHTRDPRQGALLATGRTVSSDYFATLGMRLMRDVYCPNQDRVGIKPRGGHQPEHGGTAVATPGSAGETPSRCEG